MVRAGDWPAGPGGWGGGGGGGGRERVRGRGREERGVGNALTQAIIYG